MQRSTIYSLVLTSLLAVTVTAACGKSSNPMQSTDPTHSAKVTPFTQSTPSKQSAGNPHSTHTTAGDTARKATSEPRSDPITENSSVRSGFFDAGTQASARFTKSGSATGAYAPHSDLEQGHHGTNHPPVMNQPIPDFNRVLLLPHGPPALVEFPGEPASDQDGDQLTYRFYFAVFGMTGIQTPEEALLQISRDDNRFEILPDGDITPAEFIAVYGDYANISSMPSAITASDGTVESDFEMFSLDLAYDASAQYSAPARYVTDQRWEYPDPIDWYEGTTSPVGGAFPTWTAVTSGQRNWSLDRSPDRIRCEIVRFSGFNSYEEWGDDNRLFTVSSEGRSNSGTVRLSFKTTPDFETPDDVDGDNIYRLRAVNKHNIQWIEGEGNPTGCNGSILDFAIRVKDVGVPAPPAISSAVFDASDDTVLEVTWSEPGGFLEEGHLVALPDGFEVNDYDYRYRPIGETAWTEEADDLLTDASVTIGGLTDLTYEVQVRANNREGVGAWSPAVEVTKLTHTVRFGATRYATREGDPDGVEVAVHLDPAAGSQPVTVPIEIVEENGTGPDDYSGVPSSVTFEPGDRVESFSVVALTDEDQEEGTEEFIRLRFVDLPENVSTESPSSTRVGLEDPPPNPTILSLRFSSTPQHGTWYDRNETIEVEVVFSEPVDVMAGIRPYVWLRVSFPNNKRARYAHGTGTDRLYFQYRVRLHDLDTNGVGVVGGEIEAPNGGITAVYSGLTADLHQDGLTDDPNHKIDGCL